MTKREELIKQLKKEFIPNWEDKSTDLWSVSGVADFILKDLASALIATLEGLKNDLERVDHHTVKEELWRLDEVLAEIKSEMGGV